MKHFLFIFIFILSLTVQSKNAKPESLTLLEEQLFELYNQELYDSAYNVINQVIVNPNSTNLDLCFAHIYLSHLNKRLYSYNKTFDELNSALVFAKKSKEKEMAETNVLAELSFYYFDQDSVEKADSIVISILPKANEYLDQSTHAFLLLIVGTIQFYHHNETESALNIFNRAEELLKQSNRCHLPLVYTKKLAIYAQTSQRDNYEIIKKNISENIDSCNILKYQILLAEEFKKASLSFKDYESYIKYDLMIDSLNTSYMSQAKAIDLEESISKYKIALNKTKLEKTELQQKYLSIILFICCLFILILVFFSIKLFRNSKKSN